MKMIKVKGDKPKVFTKFDGSFVDYASVGDRFTVDSPFYLVVDCFIPGEAKREFVFNSCEVVAIEFDKPYWFCYLLV